MRRTAHIATVSLGVTVLGLASLLLVVFFWPSVLLNSTTLSWAARLAKLKGVEVHWAASRVQARSRLVWEKSLALTLSEVCWRAPAWAVDGCASEVSFALAAWLEPGHLRVVSIGPTRLLAREITLGPRPAVKTGGASFDWTRRPEWLKGTLLQPTHVEVRSLRSYGAAATGPDAELNGALTFDLGDQRM